MNTVIIVIPIYKSLPDEYEKVSFRQCLKVLSKHHICILTFKSLNIDYYVNLLKEYNAIFLIEYFDAKYFKNIQGYNNLMMSKNFYKRYSKYKYMLIYQLDAYVFRDELDFWCEQGYDYIGAPWFEGYANYFSDNILGVGNGGFSLRKISSFLSIWKLKNYVKIRKSNKILYTEYIERNKNRNLYKKFRSLIYFILQVLGVKNNPFFFINQNNINEDVFWCMFLPKYLNYFKISSVKDAVSFGFEFNPSFLYKKNSNKLPFGCHAWWRYDLNFWKPFIESQDNDT